MSNLEIINYLKPKRLGAGAKTVVGKSSTETNIRSKNYGKYQKSRKVTEGSEIGFKKYVPDSIKKLFGSD